MFPWIRILLSISLFAFVFSSCKHYRVAGEKVKSEKGKVIVPYFNTAEKEFLYQADLELFGNELSGILVIKNLGNQEKRVALLSEFGNTLFDFKFDEEEVQVNYIMADLNKKIIVKKLKKYFQLLVHSTYEIKKSYAVENGKIHLSKLQGKRVFINKDKEKQHTTIRQASVFRNKVKIHFYGSKEKADSIHFNSLELPIEMDLKSRGE